MERSSQKQAFALLFVTFFIFGSIYVAGKAVTPYIPVPLVAALRCGTALIPLGLMAGKYKEIKIAKEDRKWFLIVGILGYYISPLTIQMGISLTGASMASLLNSMTPVAVTILAAVVLKEKITPAKCLCLVLAIAGTVIITRGATAEGQSLGIAAILVAVFAFAAASVFMRNLSGKYPPVLITFYGTAASMILHIPTGIIDAVKEPVVINWFSVALILYLGFVGSGLAQYTWTKSLSILPAGTCSLFYPLQPAFAAVMGAVLLGETFTASFFIGLFLISLDIVINTLAAGKEAEKNSDCSLAPNQR